MPAHSPMLDHLDPYNVVWDSPSRDASGSMPLGNGDIGVNVWCEPNGDVLLLIAKSDAWDENSINLKLGRVRLRMTLPSGPLPFRHSLNLRSGDIEIMMGQTRMRVWVDANHPVIRIDMSSDEPLDITAMVELWRTEPRQIKTQTSDLFKNLAGKDSDPHPTISSPDQIASSNDVIAWLHHNERRQHDGYAINLRLQGLGELLNQMPHPLLGRTFGAAMRGEGFRAADATTLVCAGRTSTRLSIYVLTSHPSTPDQWRASMQQFIDADGALDWETSRREHEGWWAEFWNRSWIFVSSSLPEESVATFHVTQGYILQRFMNACAGRGASPIKHNGSLFSVGKPGDPDFRRWGSPGFWFMNQRLIYWPMLAAGDFDLMLPWLQMYRDSLPLQRHRTATYFGHAGAHYPETITCWGAEISAHYGWTPFEQRTSPVAECEYVRYYWSGGIELTLILWTYWEYTQDEAFARDVLLPVADAVTEFYDAHYPRDENGKIRFEPAQALETWHDATNPTPEIAGLAYLLPRLNRMPMADDAQRARCSRVLAELPPLPMGYELHDFPIILPAERFDHRKNTENPECYCIFPYRLFGAGNRQLAMDTFGARLHRSHECWSQDDIQMALLGLTDQAKLNVTRRAAADQHSDSRFPGFWNAHRDWLPDMDHGGVLQLALQFMLMQCEGDAIRLLPAWPKEWDVDFRLHAPNRTIVEGHVRSRQLTDLHVTPESRRRNIVLGNGN